MEKARIIKLPKIEDPRGNLTFFEDNSQIPFAIERAFWTYDLPSGQVRGGHAYKEQKEFVVALSGSFDVVVINQDGSEERFHLNRSYLGLYLPAKTWRHMENFSTNALSFHVSSTLYSAEDYIRDRADFNKLHE
jgi:hypothetical protein